MVFIIATKSKNIASSHLILFGLLVWHNQYLLQAIKWNISKKQNLYGEGVWLYAYVVL